MTEILQYWPQVAAAYLVYLVAVLSPGPATMAIASASLGQGRRHGLTIAAGIFCGSMTWAIADVLYRYGEERQSRRVARAIVAARPLATTGQLASVVRKALGHHPGAPKDPATRSFQAIRIFINRELEDLELGLDAALERLKPGGRLVVISFHSLEDRIVKQFIARHAKAPPGNRRMPVAQAFTPTLLAIGDAQKATDDELATNPRARSAVLRVAEKLGLAGRDSGFAGARSQADAPPVPIPGPESPIPASEGGQP